MYNYCVNKIKSSKLQIYPFPYIAIKNFIPKDKLSKLLDILPDYKEVEEENVYYQSNSKTKKTLLPNSKQYKKLKKKKIFNEINLTLKKLKPILIKKFRSQISLFVKKDYNNSNLKFYSTFNVMKNGYQKSAHVDRREHLIHILYYPQTESKKGGAIKVMKLLKKNKSNTYDVFPSKKNIKMHKEYNFNNNFCLITLNVPWSYHSVSKYYGNNRKYFYGVYDFSKGSTGKKLKNRFKGNNQNNFWKSKVATYSESRKKIFLNE